MVNLGRCAFGGLALVTLVFLDGTATSAEGASQAAAVQVVIQPSTPLGLSATGYVTNEGEYRITNVRLRVDATDAAGRRLEPTFGWVYGDIPGRGGRGQFRVPVAPGAATCTVSVISFDLVAPESP